MFTASGFKQKNYKGNKDSTNKNWSLLTLQGQDIELESTYMIKILNRFYILLPFFVTTVVPVSKILTFARYLK